MCVFRKPQIHLTHEQQQILSHDIQQDHVVKIVAFAGTVAATTTYDTVTTFWVSQTANVDYYVNILR